MAILRIVMQAESEVTVKIFFENDRKFVAWDD